MMGTMFEPGTPLWQVAVRSVVVYAVVLVGLRLMGKRQLGQMTPFDLVVILLIANAVQNAMVGPDTSLQGGIAAAIVLLVVNWVVARVRLLTPRVERTVQGTPTLLIRDGLVIDENLKREGLTPDDVRSALREHGLAHEREARFAYLEPDGAISVVPMGAPVLRSRKHVRQLKEH